MADFLANPVRWACRCFMEQGPKGKLSVNFQSTSASSAGRSRLRAADTRSSFSAARCKNVRPRAHASASYGPHKLVQSRAEGKDWEAFQETLLASRRRFIGMAYSILRNREDAEDAVQDAILSAYLHFRGFEGRSAFTTWFARIVLNAALMIRRKRKPRRFESLSESSLSGEPFWAENIPDLHSDPEIVCAEKEALQLVDVLLDDMNPILRQAFTMVYFDEMSVAEAGALLGVSTGTFKSRLFRARQQLKDQAQRSLLAPLRWAPDYSYSSSKYNFQALAGRPSDPSSLEMTFS